MKDGMKNSYSKIDVRCKHLSSMIMGDVESDEHLRIFKCLIDTGSHVLRNAIGIKLFNNNSISFIQYLENNKHQFYHQYEKKIWRKCCSGSPHGCVFPGTMDKKIFNKMYNKTAEHNTQYCLDRFETNAGISLDGLDLSDLNFFLWNSSSLSAQEEHSLKIIMSIRSAICHPSSSHSYTIDELEIYWSDLKSAVVMFAEPKCYKDIVEMQVETLQNCKLNVIESAKVIEKMKIESNKILHAIKQETPLKIVEKLIKDGTCGLENCVKSENNKTQSYINDTFQVFKENIEKHHEELSTSCREKIQTTVTQESSNIRLHSEEQSRAIDTKLTESEQRVCQTVIQSQGRLQDKVIEEQNKTRNHTVELKADLIEENRILKDEVMDVKTELKELKTILIGYIGKQKVDLVMNTDQIEKSIESPDKRKVDFTAKVNQTHVTADEENEIIEKLPPEVEIQTNNEGLPDAAVTETIEITGKKVNSIILELKATPGILHSVETFKAAILTLVQVMQKAGGIDADIEDTVTVNLKFESPLTEDQFAVVNCIFAKELNDGCNTKQLSAEYSSISNEYSSTFDEYSSTSDEYSSTSDEYLSTEDVNEMEFRSEPDTYSQKETSEVFQLETKETLIKPCCELCDYKDKIMKALYEQIDIYVRINKRNTINSIAKNNLYECRHCYEMKDIIVQLDRGLCEIRRRIIEAKEQSFHILYENNVCEDILKITDQYTSMTSTEEKGRMIDKEFQSDRSSQDSKIIPDFDVRDLETKANMKLMELQANQGSRPALVHTEERSDLGLRISEIRREYASSYYTKTDKQKGLGIILQDVPYVRDPDIAHLKEFFEEIGFVVKCTDRSDWRHLLQYMTNENWFCVFFVFKGYWGYDEYPIRRLLSKKIGKPVIIMTDFIFPVYHIADINENNDILIVQPTNQGRIDSLTYYGKSIIFDAFEKATLHNRFADIMDILTQMNALYDYSIITFQSTLRKKFRFL